MKRRTFIGATALALAVSLGSMASAGDLPPLAKKDRYKVGFAQMESNNPWRIAETKSFHEPLKPATGTWLRPTRQDPPPSRWPTSIP